MTRESKVAYPLLTRKHLAVEQAVLRRAYPQFRLVWTAERLAFRGPLRSNYGSVFIVDVRLPPRYPEQEPHLWVVSPELPPRTQHVYVDGRICAHADPFVAYQTTVATMVSVMAGWIYRFERHRTERIPWETPIVPPGRALSIHPDGTLHLRRRRRR